MNIEHARDWFCRENNISNNIAIYPMPSDQEIIQALKVHGHYDMLYRTSTGPLTDFYIAKCVREEARGLHFLPFDSPFESSSSFIILNTDNYDTLFHELVHHRQSVRKELTVTSPDGYYFFKTWKGREIHPNTNHYNMPHEIEAMKEEQMWTDKYFQTQSRARARIMQKELINYVT